MAKEKRKFKDTIWYTLIMMCIFLLIVPIIIQIPFSFFNFTSESNFELSSITTDYLLYPGFTLISFIILFMLKENKDIRKILSFKNNKIIYGLLIGFSLNALRVLIAYFCGNVRFGLGSTNMLILLYAFICVLVQSTSEEIVCRGYLFSKILKDYKNPVFAIVFNSLLFALFHLSNNGIGVVSIISIFVVGIFLSLITYYNKNIWMAVGFHAMWNFTQNFIFGLPNSGYPAVYSVLKLVDASDGFAYNKVFGIEGTVIGIIIDCIVIALVYYLHKNKRSKK